MRDAVAGLVAVLLLLLALSLATTLRTYRRRRQRARDTERALGRKIIAELPAKGDLILVSEDEKRFYYGDQSIDKDLIVAVRVLINGAPLAEYVSRRQIHNLSTAQPRAERGGGVPAERDRGAGAPGVIEDRGGGVPAERNQGAGARGVKEDQPEGIARDRWDVALETVAGTVLIECGTIRERVSQELARTIFEAVRSDLEQRDHIPRGAR